MGSLSNGAFSGGGGSVYYPGQRHPDMLPGDEALWHNECGYGDEDKHGACDCDQGSQKRTGDVDKLTMLC